MGKESCEKSVLVPRLRFPEFRGAAEWKPKSIGDSCESFSGGTPSTTNKSFYGGEIPFIRSAEIDRDETELFLTTEALENSAAKMVTEGDILVALYGANSGDVALAKINGAINQAILCLRHETNNRFVYQYLAHRKEWIIATFIQGGQGNLSGEIIKAIRLCFPKPEEQQKIADCLSSLDELITAETQKLDALKTHKKGLMQQLFPREGETEPRLRFPEFREAGEWEERPLLHYIASLDAGVSVNSGDRSACNNEIGVLKTSCVSDGNFDSTENKVVQEPEEIVRVKEPVCANTIIISRMNTIALVGANAFVENDIPSLFLPDRLWAAKSTGRGNMRFLAYVLGSEGGRAALSGLAAGSSGTMKNIGKSEVLALQVTVPTITEQERIADCLSSLDALITAQSQKIDALKIHKKGLMQQLFPLDEAPA